MAFGPGAWLFGGLGELERTPTPLTPLKTYATRHLLGGIGGKPEGERDPEAAWKKNGSQEPGTRGGASRLLALPLRGLGGRYRRGERYGGCGSPPYVPKTSKTCRL